MFPMPPRRSVLWSFRRWVLALCAFAMSHPALAQAEISGCLSDEEQALVQLINEYRQQEGHAPIPASFSLTEVSQWHVWDLEINDPVGGSCNLHSWSDARPQLWNAVCYTSDHAQASGMWNKPEEITGGVYSANGYEIAYWTSGTATAASALSGWKNSSGHNDVILNQDIWASRDPWPAMGVGILGGHAVIWFGDASDPQQPQPCGGTPSSPETVARSLQMRSLHPNPFNPQLTISFTLLREQTIRTTIHDASGRQVRSLPSRLFTVGDHDVAWDGTDQGGHRLASGVYYVRLETESESQTRKVALIE